MGWAGEIFVAAVFDGHGLGGEVASEACVECLERAVGNPFLQVRFSKVRYLLHALKLDSAWVPVARTSIALEWPLSPTNCHLWVSSQVSPRAVPTQLVVPLRGEA